VEPAVKRRVSACAPLVVPCVIALVLTACGNDSSPSAINPQGDEAKRIAGVWWLMFGLAIAVYVVVAGFVIVSGLRGRRRGARDAAGDEPLHDSKFIWVGGIIVPVMILVLLAVVTVHTGAALRNPKAGELRVDVAGERWWWRVSYHDPSFETANEIHLPVGRPVAIRLTSDNVVHSFWVPQLASKVDTIPGQPNVLRFRPEKIGVYRGLCAEFCGIQHARMQFLVIVQSPEDFGRWQARRENPAAEPTSEAAARGRMVFEKEACAGCHTIDGTSAQGTLGPNLTDLGTRSTIASATLDNTTHNLTEWIENPRKWKPGVIMPPAVISHDDVRAIVAYLESLK
jgi:cytochrome c oxidase subunit 2